MKSGRDRVQRRELSHHHASSHSEINADELERAVGTLASADDLEREVVHPTYKPGTRKPSPLVGLAES